MTLDDFVTLCIRSFLEATDLRHFPVQDQSANKEEFAKRLSDYEDATKELQQIVILVAKWGSPEQLLLLEKIFVRIAEADRGSSGGRVVWLRLIWYPIMILMYSAGISAIASKRYDVLIIILQTLVEANPLDGKGRQPLIMPVTDNISDLHSTFKLLPGLEQKYVPRSEHLYKILQPTIEDLLFLGRNYESYFDLFEMLYALIYSDVSNRQWGPPGRFSWKETQGFGEGPLTQMSNQLYREKEQWPPLKAGLFESSVERATKLIEDYKVVIQKMNWW